MTLTVFAHNFSTWKYFGDFLLLECFFILGSFYHMERVQRNIDITDILIILYSAQ